MAKATSPATGRCYGVARVCQVWDVPRSSFYAAQQASTAEAGPKLNTARRGPKPAISDEGLLAAIRADLARSPWTGEGHRKVWARLRAMDGLRVSRKRVLRLMRQHALLSPHRTRTRPETSHERQIITNSPFERSWGRQSPAIGMSEALEHEADRGQGDHRLGDLGQRLVVLG